MKKILYILIALAVLAGCDEQKPDNPGNNPGTENPGENNQGGGNQGGGEVTPVKPETPTQRISGEWHCSATNPKADIYLSLANDGTFELYQQINVGVYRLYRGTWTLDETTMVISGQYNDGEKWSCDYTVGNYTIGEDGYYTAMTFTDPDKNVYSYTRKEIPAEVKDTCHIEVKSPYAD